MKCEICYWAEMPDSVPSMSRHIGTYHQDIVPDQVIVWKNSEMILVEKYNGKDQLINVYVQKVVPSPKEKPLFDYVPLETETVKDFEDTPTVIDLDELP